MEPGQRRKPRWGTLTLVIAGHLVVGAVLIRAFAPDLPQQAIEAVGSMVTVTITAPPDPTPSAAPDSGAAGAEGARATPRPASAPSARVPVRPTPIPRASSTGASNASGARDEGDGTGAGGQGSGTGSGAGGSGQGGGATKPVHIGGAIDRARDYPVPEGGRDARIGKSVIVALTVGIDGRASACRVYRASGLPETDQVTCRLAVERLRFRPATNPQGEPVVGTFYWQQRFFY
jgi:protein TonB